MTITARFTSRCPRCGFTIEPGDQVEWSRGQKARHTACPTAAVSNLDKPDVILAGAPPRSTERRNRKADSCMSCGTWVPAGAGELIACVEDSGCMQHHDYSGYHVACLDRSACEQRRAEAIAAAKAKRAHAQERAATIRRLEDSGRNLGRGASIPTGAEWIVLQPSRPGSMAPPALQAAIAAEACYLYRPVYDDDPVITELPASNADTLRALAVA